MDKKPPIDLEKLKKFQDLRKKKEQVEETPVERPKPDPSLTDPYFNRHHIIRVEDFDEWEWA